MTEIHEFSSLNRPQIFSSASRIFHLLPFLPCFSCDQRLSRHWWKRSVSGLCSKGDPDGRTCLNPDNLNSKPLRNIICSLFTCSYTHFPSEVIIVFREVTFQRSQLQAKIIKKYLPLGFCLSKWFRQYSLLIFDSHQKLCNFQQHSHTQL